MKIVTLNKDEFTNFARDHKYGNFYQTKEYCSLMRNFGFGTHYLGFLDNSNALIGATLILYKELPATKEYKYGYAPRGFLIDYTNKELVKSISNELRKLLQKQKFIYIKIDPMVILNELNEKAEVIYKNPNAEEIIMTLKENGYVHYGFNTYFETMKARNNAFIRLEKDFNGLYETFDKETRNKIKKAKKQGIEIYKDSLTNDVNTIFEFIKEKHNRSKEYYQQLYNLFSENNMIDIYYSRINIEKFLANSQENYEKELQLNNRLAELMQDLKTKEKDKRKLVNMKMESDKNLYRDKKTILFASNLLKNGKEEITIGGTIIIKYKKGINLLIDGYDKNFSQFNSNYLIKWEIIKEYATKGYLYFNLNGVTRDFINCSIPKFNGLNASKIGYNSTIIEYIGEFDLVINKQIYDQRIKKANIIQKRDNSNNES